MSRDRILEKWSYIESLPDLSTEMGSGYPGDPNCKSWLQTATDPIFGYPSIVALSPGVVTDRVMPITVGRSLLMVSTFLGADDYFSACGFGAGIVRFSWSTTKKLLKEHCAPVAWEDDESDDDTPSVMTFFGGLVWPDAPRM